MGTGGGARGTGHNESMCAVDVMRQLAWRLQH